MQGDPARTDMDGPVSTVTDGKVTGTNRVTVSRARLEHVATPVSARA
jgi:hypothetical protein